MTLGATWSGYIVIWNDDKPELGEARFTSCVRVGADGKSSGAVKAVHGPDDVYYESWDELVGKGWRNDPDEAVLAALEVKEDHLDLLRSSIDNLFLLSIKIRSTSVSKTALELRKRAGQGRRTVCNVFAPRRITSMWCMNCEYGRDDHTEAAVITGMAAQQDESARKHVEALKKSIRAKQDTERGG